MIKRGIQQVSKGFGIIIVAMFLVSYVSSTFISVNVSWSLPDWGWARVPIAMSFGELERGDKVEFTPPIESSFTSSKIIMGLAGDTVTIIDQEVFVNDYWVGTAKAKTRDGRKLQIISSGVIPKNHFFMAGTHADSYDSRYAEIGLIPKSAITARLWRLPNIPWLGLDGPLITREKHDALSLISKASAADLGIAGEIFAIAEPDLMESIKAELTRAANDGRLDEFNNKLTQQAKGAFNRQPSLNLPQVTQSTSRHFDPSMTVGRDIRTHEGKLIAARGTYINPLERIFLRQPLIFIDGDNDAQMAWAIAQNGKIILTGGNPLALMNKHDLRLYFDQKAVLTQRFGITAVPTIISQDGLMLKIDEIVIPTPENEGAENG